jgi:hypothetical protein
VHHRTSNQIQEPFPEIHFSQGDLLILRVIAIFAGRSLRDMTIRLRQSPAEFRGVYGVGEHKTGKFGEVFMEVICEHCQPVGKSAAPVIPVWHVERLDSDTFP